MATVSICEGIQRKADIKRERRSTSLYSAGRCNPADRSSQITTLTNGESEEGGNPITNVRPEVTANAVGHHDHRHQLPKYPQSHGKHHRSASVDLREQPDSVNVTQATPGRRWPDVHVGLLIGQPHLGPLQ